MVRGGQTDREMAVSFSSLKVRWVKAIEEREMGENVIFGDGKG
jgi:hypothetical protein